MDQPLKESSATGKNDVVHGLENVSSTSASNETPQKTRNGVLLVPQPSDDPRDPLNWPQAKKIRILVILSLASFAGTASSLANQLGLFPQAKTYHKTPVETSYTVSAAVAGFAAGPLIISPLAQKVGRSSVIFWSLVMSVVCCIWSAEMTKRNQYGAFVAASVFRGLFGATPAIAGTRLLIDLFYLHERGKAFAFYTWMFMLGILSGPTFSGFIVQHTDWPVEFWWNVASLGFVALLAFVFLEETGWTRDSSKKQYPIPPQGWLSNRVATYFPGTKVTPYISARQVGFFAFSQILIGLSPMGLIVGLYQFINFGWFVMINTLLAVFLESPIDEGGYAFTPQQNAAFSFALWFGLFVAEGCAYAFNDRIPLWICRRRGGKWKPEYRLHCLWIPNILLPIGLGIFGASLEHHLHYMVLAFGSFLITVADMFIIAVLNTYVSESFIRHASEAACVMSFYRVLLGLIVPFFINPWIAEVGVGWVFGIAAFLSVGCFGAITFLTFKGHDIRRMAIRGLDSDEEGQMVTSSEPVEKRDLEER